MTASVQPLKADQATLEKTKASLGLFGALGREVDPETGEVKVNMFLRSSVG